MILLILITFSIDDVLKLFGENWFLSYLGLANKITLHLSQLQEKGLGEILKRFRLNTYTVEPLLTATSLQRRRFLADSP